MVQVSTRHKEGRMPRFVQIGAVVHKEFGPDTMVVDIRIEGGDHDREACIASYNARFSALRNALLATGLEASEIQSDRLDIAACQASKTKRERGFHRGGAAEGYEYRSSIAVEVPVSKRTLERLWKAVVDTDKGADFCIRFKLKDEDAAKAELLCEAVTEGRKRAEALASAAGERLGRVLSISHDFTDEEEWFGSSLDMDNEDDEASKASPSAAPEFNPATIEVECSVSVEWELLD
ncbi:DUF541 domain-containing protein [Eggerthellaceae bacterium zg-887]|nr:DUF541 domain-containing protein [Xiamenia xianingshaonis]